MKRWNRWSSLLSLLGLLALAPHCSIEERDFSNFGDGLGGSNAGGDGDGDTGDGDGDGDRNGEGGAAGDCDCADRESCSGGECYSWDCEPNEAYCSGDKVLKCADDGLSSDEVEACGEDQYCDVASATCKEGVCAPNQPTCVSNSVRYCNGQGTGYESNGTDCGAGKICFGDGQCGECLPDDTRACGTCSDGVQTCSTSGAWGDCKDAGSQYSCTAKPPNGWDGPVVFSIGADSPPDCAGAYPSSAATGSSDLSAGAATCGACSCGAPYHCSIWGGQSSPSTMVLSASGTCGGESYAIPNPAETSTCYAPGFVLGSRASSDHRNPSTDAATPSGGDITKPSPSFGESGQVCSAPSAPACDSGEGVCAPHPSGAYAASPVCIYRIGEHSCPSSFPQRQMLYGGYDDTRSCSACACDGDCGTVTERKYTTTDCTGSYDSVTIPNSGSSGSCYGLSGYASFSYARTSSTFSPSTSTLAGSFTETDPTTICCLE